MTTKALLATERGDIEIELCLTAPTEKLAVSSDDNIPVISESLTSSEWGIRRFTGTAKTFLPLDVSRGI